jgi:hypothetical protein
MKGLCQAQVPFAGVHGELRPKLVLKMSMVRVCKKKNFFEIDGFTVAPIRATLFVDKIRKKFFPWRASTKL